MLTQRAARITLSFCIVLLFVLYAAGLFRFAFFEYLEAKAYDFRLLATLQNTVDKRIVIVDLDERSLADYGRWPWSRNVLAEMVDTLFEHYNIRLLAFDVVFAEEDTSSGLRSLDALARGRLKNNSDYLSALREIRSSLEYDRQFAKSLQSRNVVLGYYFKNSLPENESAASGVLPPALMGTDNPVVKRLPFTRALGYGGNIAQLQSSTRYGGYFDNPMVDSDGRFRRFPIVQLYQDKIYGALSLSVIQALQPDGNIQFHLGNDADKVNTASYLALEGVQVGDVTIPVDEQGAVLIPYRGRQGSFPYVSATDVISKKAAEGTFKDAIVLVGTTAPGLLDLRSTPVQHVYPGVEVHANVISGALDGKMLHRPAYTVGYEALIMMLTGTLMTLLLINITPLRITLIALGLVSALTALNLYAWAAWQLVLPLAIILLLILSLFVFHISFGFFVETRGKRQLAKLFGQYIPPELVDEMDKAPEDVSLHGESREMTVLFSDVRGFTTISESLEPRELTALMNAFLTPMTGVIHRCRGTIDKYMGDAVMAFWGAPLHDPNHARNALTAATKMIEKLNALKPEFERRGWPEIDIGIGINTGIMNVGNMGSEFRMAYTVLGDAVNLGSRLESLTKQYGVDIIVGEDTKTAIPDYRFRELDKVTVKGKDEPTTLYEPVAPTNLLDDHEKTQLRSYHDALKKYRQQQWDDAEQIFYFLARNDSRQIYRIYLDRIAHYRKASPGPAWDGVFRHDSK